MYNEYTCTRICDSLIKCIIITIFQIRYMCLDIKKKIHWKKLITKNTHTFVQSSIKQVL